MPFNQLKYSERNAEKSALLALLDEYFVSRAATRPQIEPEAGPNLKNLPLKSAKSAPMTSPETTVKKSKPPLPASRTPSSLTSTSSPLPRAPPPINRTTRPSSAIISPAVLGPPPLLETPALWAGSISKFEYPPPDHSAPGINIFNRLLPYPINELHSAAISIFEILYPDPAFKPKAVQSPVKLIMRDMDGVAHAANSMSYSGTFTGQSFSNVIHRSDFVFSTQYLTGLEHHPDPAFEIRGIILHELTHTFQYSAHETPGGLIEGIADFVRLRGKHAAKHWTESPAGKKWDQGYETTAYFLDWADKNIYEGLVAYVNEWLGKNQKYDEGRLFDSLMPGWSWEVLWEQYLASR